MSAALLVVRPGFTKPHTQICQFKKFPCGAVIKVKASESSNESSGFYYIQHTFG